MADTLTRIQVSGTYQDPNRPDFPVAGKIVQFIPNAKRIMNAAGATICVPQTLNVVLDDSGAFSVPLIATDDPAGTPTGWTYTVKEPFGTDPYPILVPFDSPGLAVDLVDIAPAAAQSGGTVQLVGGIGITGVSLTPDNTALVFDMSDGSQQTSPSLPYATSSSVTSGLASNAAATAAVSTALGAVTPANSERAVGQGQLIINVRDYGTSANADGTVDDTSVINAAYAALPSSGGRLLFDTGTWTYNGADLVIGKDNVELTGMGRSTVLAFTDGGIHVNGQSAFRSATRLAQFHVTRAGTAGPAIRFSGGGSGKGAIRWVMSDVHVDSSTGPAFSSDGAFIGDLFGCYLRSATIGFEAKLDAIAGTVAGNAITMHGGEIQACTQAVNISNTAGIAFIGTTIEGSSTSGVTLAGNCRGVLFSGCYFESNNGFDITVGSASPTGFGLSVNGCYFAHGTSTGTYAIILVRCMGVSIAGNTFLSYSTTPVQVNESSSGQVQGLATGNSENGGFGIVTVTAGTKWTTSVGGSTVNAYTTAGTFTWTKPVVCNAVMVLCISAGGGGGSGRRGAAATVRCGGGGGGGGGYTYRIYPASVLNATESVVVGAGGAGGAAVTTDDTDGNVGTAGGISTFKSQAATMMGSGGGAGGPGTATTGTAGSAGGSAGGIGGIGGLASTTGSAGGAGGTTGVAGGTGGGAGGGVTSGNTVTTGGAGGTNYGNTGGTAGATSGGAGGTATATAVDQPGIGGGGGGSNITGAGGAGGAGTKCGGGGGGGGASLNGNASGAGGAGADGVVVVVAV